MRQSKNECWHNIPYGYGPPFYNWTLNPGPLSDYPFLWQGLQYAKCLHFVELITELTDEQHRPGRRCNA